MMDISLQEVRDYFLMGEQSIQALLPCHVFMQPILPSLVMVQHYYLLLVLTPDILHLLYLPIRFL